MEDLEYVKAYIDDILVITNFRELNKRICRN